MQPGLGPRLQASCPQGLKALFCEGGQDPLGGDSSGCWGQVGRAPGSWRHRGLWPAVWLTRPSIPFLTAETLTAVAGEPCLPAAGDLRSGTGDPEVKGLPAAPRPLHSPSVSPPGAAIWVLAFGINGETATEERHG